MTRTLPIVYAAKKDEMNLVASIRLDELLLDSFANKYSVVICVLYPDGRLSVDECSKSLRGLIIH